MVSFPELGNWTEGQLPPAFPPFLSCNRLCPFPLGRSLQYVVMHPEVGEGQGWRGKTTTAKGPVGWKARSPGSGGRGAVPSQGGR